MNVLNLESTADVQLRRFPEAERVTRYLIDVDRKHHSRLTPDDAADIMNLGQIEEGQLRYTAAEPYYREALKILESWFPENHPEVANTKRMLAQDLEILGKNEEATILAKETLADLEHAYGPAHRRVAYMLRVLYKLAYKRHDLDAAHAYASREVSIYRQIGNTADLPAALSNVADIDVAQHHPRAAEPLYEEAIRRFPSTEYAGSLIFAHAQLALGRLRNDEKRYSDAASLLGQSLALWRKQPVFQKQRTIDTLAALAVASDGMGRHQEAAAYRREAEAISH